MLAIETVLSLLKLYFFSGKYDGNMLHDTLRVLAVDWSHKKNYQYYMVNCVVYHFWIQVLNRLYELFNILFFYFILKWSWCSMTLTNYRIKIDMRHLGQTKLSYSDQQVGHIKCISWTWFNDKLANLPPSSPSILYRH